jgi:hypothetical protein
MKRIFLPLFLAAVVEVPAGPLLCVAVEAMQQPRAYVYRKIDGVTNRPAVK